MRFHILLGALCVLPVPVHAQQVEKVPAGSPGAPALPEDLFGLPPDTWSIAKQLWKGNEACTKDQCEAGFTSGDLVVSIERSKKYVRVVAGFRNCASVAWNEYEIGDKASKRDNKTIEKRVKKVIEASAKYCKAVAPTVAALDVGRLFPQEAETRQ
jgi:hypothetical protein